MTPDSSPLEKLAQAKIEARQKLLALDPEEAQKRVDAILHPQLWQLDPEQSLWQESLPTDDQDFDS